MPGEGVVGVRGSLYYALQILITFSIMMPLQLIVALLHEAHPRTLLSQVSRGPYYWVTQKKRAANDEPLWQQHDWTHLGIPNPDWPKSPRITEVK